jgi:hypothetical protein
VPKDTQLLGTAIVDRPKLKPGPKARPINDDLIVFRPYVKINRTLHPDLHRIVTSVRYAGYVNDFILEALDRYARSLASENLENRPLNTDNEQIIGESGRQLPPPSFTPEINTVSVQIPPAPATAQPATPQTPELRPKPLTGFLARARENAQ